MLTFKIPTNTHRKITPESTYRLYVMLKTHFNGSYCLEKYKWKMNLSPKSFQKRKDKYFFVRLAERLTLNEQIFLFIANFSSNEDAWIGELSDSDSFEVYNAFTGRIQSLQETYREAISSMYYFAKKIGKPMKDLFYYNEEIGTSYIFRLLQSRIISFETFLLLDSFLNIMPNHDMHKNIVWDSYSVRLNAYKKLVTIDSNLAKSKLKSTLNDIKG